MEAIKNTCLYMFVVILFLNHEIKGCEINVGVVIDISNDTTLIEKLEVFYNKSSVDNVKLIFHPIRLEKPEERFHSLMTYQAMKKVFDQMTFYSVKVVVGTYNIAVETASIELEIPYIATNVLMGEQPDNVVELLPSNEMITTLVHDMADHHQWHVPKHIGLLHDSKYGVQTMERFAKDTRFILKSWKQARKTNKTQLRQNLLDIRSQSIQHIIVQCENDISQLIFDEGLRLSIMSHIFHWIFPSLDPYSIDTDLYIYTAVNYTTLNIMSSEFLEENSQQIPQKELFTSAIAHDIVQILEEVSTSLMTLGLDCKNVTKSLDCKIHEYNGKGALGSYSFDEHGKRRNLTIDLLALSDDGLRLYGDWKSSARGRNRRLRIQNTRKRPLFKSLPQEGYSFEKRPVRVVTVLEPPFVMLNDKLNAVGNDRFKGYCLDLLKAIAKKMNFNYEIYLVNDGEYGEKKEDGSWSGIVGELIKENATFSMAALTITKNREEVIDFSKPYKTIGVSLLMKKPKDKSMFFQFLHPLSLHVWILILIAFIIISLGTTFVEFMTTSPKFRRFNLKESFWFNYGSLVKNTTPIEKTPQTFSGRILTSVWWFFSLIIISSYTANLAAFLTVSRINADIDSIIRLADQDNIRYGTVKRSQVESFFQTSSTEAYYKMWMKMTSNNQMVTNSVEGIEKVRKSDPKSEYAFLWDTPVVRYATMNDCDLMEIGNPVGARGYGIGLPVGAPYRDDITMAILELKEEGKMTELDAEWWRNSKCDDLNKSPTGNQKALNPHMVLGVFLLLGIGIVISLLVALLQRLIRDKKQRTKPKGKPSEYGRKSLNVYHASENRGQLMEL